MENDGLELQKDEILHDYRIAVRSRLVDEAEAALQKAGKAMFCILSGGQEVAQIASTIPLRPGDWVRGYYRSGTEALAIGVVTVRQMIAQVLGDTEPGHDPASGGRMMGRHIGGRLLDDNGDLTDLMGQINRASDISSTGSQMPVALGLARASQVFRDVRELDTFNRLSDRGKEVALVTVGDSSMAEGTALEAVFQGAVQRVPLVVSVLDNGYGITVPVEHQTPHGSISKALQGLDPQLRIFGPIKGWDYPKSVKAYRNAFDWVREGRGPALVHALVTQPFGHSSSGDHRRYKSAERLQWEKDNDCNDRTRAWILAESIATEEELAAIEGEEKDFVKKETDGAWEDYQQPIRTLAGKAIELYQNIPEANSERIELAKKIDPKNPEAVITRADIVTSIRRVLRARQGQASTEPIEGVDAISQLHNEIMDDGKERYSGNVYAEGEKSPINRRSIVPKYDDSEIPEDTGAHIIAAGIATLMAADPHIVCYGEDVGKIGGVTTCTLGLQRGEIQILPEILRKSPALQKYVPHEGFGESRVWDHAIAEASIVGSAAGMALRGLRPIVEIQYHDYVVWALQQMVDEIACLRHRTDGGQSAPMLIRTHGHQLVGMWHSGSPMGMILAACPGLRILVPRNAVQAVGMYRAVLLSDDPAFSVEPLQKLYTKENVPNNLDEICIPLGQSEILHPGNHATVITYGTCCAAALEAAQELEKEGILVEVVDLQTLNPLDVNGVALASIKKTGRVLFFDEDVPSGATAMIAKTLLHDREGILHAHAIKCLTAPEHKPPYGRDGKFFGKPQASDLVQAIEDLLKE